MTTANIGIHIFRKDLRIYDNLALYELSTKVKKIIPIFILDENQIIETNKNKNYISYSAIQFICESLIDLNKYCNNKLLLFLGDPTEIIKDIINNIDIDYISFNADFTKYSTIRDSKIIDICKSNNINYIVNNDDSTIIPINHLCKNDKTAYSVYGAFMKNEKKILNENYLKNQKIKLIDTINYNFVKSNELDNYKNKKHISFLKSLYVENKLLAERGGRSRALEKINMYKGDFDNRDILINQTMKISAYLNFGLLSVREFYNYWYKNISVISQLFWRDFYISILYFNPESREYNFISDDYKNIKWVPQLNDWKSMINCKTGFLLIDASMKELLTTGFINNRSRLLLGTFWSKLLLINPFDPKYGSQVGFSKYLVDCSVSQNKFNHHWITSELDLNGRRFHKKGCKSMSGRVIRIDNQMIKKYDPTCEYIKKWLPEIKDKSLKELINTKTIFNYDERYIQYCKLFS